MTEQNRLLSESKVKWLTYLVYLLLVFLTVATLYLQKQVTDIQRTLPQQYICKEDYRRDQDRAEREGQTDKTEILQAMKSIDKKLEQILKVQNNLDKRTAILEYNRDKWNTKGQ